MPEAGYIRIGGLPEGGRSYDHLRRRFEGGVSAFRGEKVSGREYVLRVGTAEEGAILRSLVQGVPDTPVYFLQGREVGRGGVGEPVLQDITHTEAIPLEATVTLPMWTPAFVKRWNDYRNARALLDGPAPTDRTTLGIDREAVPNASALVRAVLSRATASDSAVHGPEHWKRVAVAGLILLREQPEADALVVFLFSVFHDAMRQTDGHDPDHGRRGGELARELHGRHHFISEAQMDLLQAACDGHAAGSVSKDPTIGACWDADRVNLWRVGKQLDPAFFSAWTAPRLGRVDWAFALRRAVFNWETLFQFYGLPWSGKPLPSTTTPPALLSFGDQIKAAKKRQEEVIRGYMKA